MFSVKIGVGINNFKPHHFSIYEVAMKKCTKVISQKCFQEIISGFKTDKLSKIFQKDETQIATRNAKVEFDLKI